MAAQSAREGPGLRLGPLPSASDEVPADGDVRPRSRPDPRCIIDRDRPCRGCIAASPRECPYPYLLD
jgi:hypothetical protein